MTDQQTQERVPPLMRMTAASMAWSIKWMADKGEPLWRISEAARLLASQLDEQEKRK